MIKFLKKWIWLPFITLLATLALWLLGGNDKWRKEKEREIKERQKKIEELEESDPLDVYEEVKADYDEAIRKAKEKEGRPPITNVDDARDYLDGLLDKLRE